MHLGAQTNPVRHHCDELSWFHYTKWQDDILEAKGNDVIVIYDHCIRLHERREVPFVQVSGIDVNPLMAATYALAVDDDIPLEQGVCSQADIP